MKKKILWSVFALSIIITNPVFAGGLLTNTNQSVHFLRNPARDASTEIDAAYTNPAGLSKLSTEGFHFSINNQSAFQTRVITSTFAPFAGSGGSATKEFKGTASVPVIPSIQAAYKKDKWVLSGNIAIVGGGGKATFNHGLPSFESPISMLPPAITQFAQSMDPSFTCNSYSVDSYMSGSSIIYGAQLGGTYEINKIFSVYGGFRLNIVNNGYEGHLRDIQFNPKSANPALGSGAMVSASQYFTALSGLPSLASQEAMLKGYAASTADKNLDCTQSGWGISPIVGFNMNYQNLNIGMKYEFKTGLNVENKTKVDDTGLFKDGVNTPHDIPALFTVGASYQVIPQLMVSVGYHHFFDTDADMAETSNLDKSSEKIGKQNFIDHGTNEYLAGLEYRINDMFLISSGIQFTRYGVTDTYQSDLSFSINSYAIGVGGAVNVSKNVRINIGYFWCDYTDWTKTSKNYNGSGIQGTDVFSRTNKVFGAGVDFRF